MEGFGPKLHYIKCEANVLSDTLSQLDMIPATKAIDQNGSGRNQHSTKSKTSMFSLFQIQNQSMILNRNKAPTAGTTPASGTSKNEDGQYYIALALLEDGVPLLGILGCPNVPQENDASIIWTEK